MKVSKYLEFVARLHGVSDIKGSTARVIEQLSLGDRENRLIGNLSKGYKQRVGLAQSLFTIRPFLSLMNRPTDLILRRW